MVAGNSAFGIVSKPIKNIGETRIHFVGDGRRCLFAEIFKNGDDVVSRRGGEDNR